MCSRPESLTCGAPGVCRRDLSPPAGDGPHEAREYAPHTDGRVFLGRTGQDPAATETFVALLALVVDFYTLLVVAVLAARYLLR
jgi:hypothetical protein